jgi:predicted Zn-dependent protease
MIFRHQRGAGRPELERRLRSLDEQAELALPGFDAQYFNRAGDLCVEAGQGDRALTYYGRAIDAYLRAGRYNASGAVCRKLLRVAPDAVRARCTLAWLSIGKGMTADARREVGDYVVAAIAAGQVELARKQLRLMGRATRNPELRTLLAEQLRELGDSTAAARLLEPPPVRDADDDALWSSVLRAALMGPDDLLDPA